MSETGCLYRATSIRGHTRKGMEERLVRRPCGSHPILRERSEEVTLGRIRFDESSALQSKHTYAIYRARLGRGCHCAIGVCFIHAYDTFCRTVKRTDSYRWSDVWNQMITVWHASVSGIVVWESKTSLYEAPAGPAQRSRLA
jgi:hypothetical protein